MNKPTNQVPPRKNKNIVTVGELKKKKAELLERNAQMEGIMKAEGQSDPEFLKSIAANNAAINKYSKIIANPEKYKPATPAKNPNILTVGRLKEVRDSLLEKADSKGRQAINIMMTKPSSQSFETYRKRINEYEGSAAADRERALRYDKIIKKASKKK